MGLTLQKKSQIKLLCIKLHELFKLPYIFLILILWQVLSQALSLSGVSLDTLNKLSLVLILTTCLGGCSYLIISNKVRFWHPITWFLFTSALYYGFGPTLYYFTNFETISFVNSYYPVNDKNLFLVNSVVLIGVAGVIFFYFGFSVITRANKKMPLIDYSSRLNPIAVRKIYMAACFLIIVGIPVKIIFTLPYSLGLVGGVLPGFIKNIENFSILALIPLYLIREVSLKFKLAFYILAIFSIITAFLSLSKLAILLTIFVIFLAARTKGISIVRLGLIGLLILVIYAKILSPMVTYGRMTINLAGVQSVTDATQLALDIGQGKTSEFISEILPKVQGWWARFNYANAQAFAIERYHSGNNGNTLSGVQWVFVPRLLYPDKPNLSYGSYFNELVDGNPNSSSGPGILVEGYWNAGWCGVIYVSFVMALLYFLWEIYINSQLKKSQFQYLPVIFIGLFAALTQDSWFVMTTFANLTLAIAMHLFISILFRLRVSGMVIYKIIRLKNN